MFFILGSEFITFLRRGDTARGKSKVPAGRKARMLSQKQDVHSMPIRKEPKGKRVHSLQQNIMKGLQNAGKW